VGGSSPYSYANDGFAVGSALTLSFNSNGTVTMNDQGTGGVVANDLPTNWFTGAPGSYDIRVNTITGTLSTNGRYKIFGTTYSSIGGLSVPTAWQSISSGTPEIGVLLTSPYVFLGTAGIQVSITIADSATHTNSITATFGLEVGGGA
jgi:hypothetical protein